MAKKEKLKSDPLKIDDDLDFGDFSAGFDFEAEAAAPKNDRNPVKRAVKGAISGATSRATERDFLNKAAKEILPPTYGEITSGLGEIRKGLGSLYDDTVREIKPELKSLSEKLDKLVPESAKRTKGVTRRLKEMVGGGSKSSIRSEESVREDSIKAAMAEVFSVTAEENEKDKERVRAETKVRDAIEGKRFQDTFGTLKSIDENITRLTLYNDKINQSFQKKSLELQLRSYYVQAESLKTSQKYFDAFQKQLESVVKNTALPEYAKINIRERFKQKGWANLTNAVVGDGSYIAKGFSRMRKSAAEKIGSVRDIMEGGGAMLDSVLSARETQQMMAEMGEIQDKFKDGGAMAGGMLPDFILKKASPWLKKKLDQYPGLLERLAQGAGMVVDTPGAVRRAKDSKYLRNLQEAGGNRAKLGNALETLLGFFEEEAMDTKLTRKSDLASLSQAHEGGFDKRTHLTINEIIPGYLARIHQEIRSQRLGTEVEMTSFDLTRGKFIGKEEMRKRTGEIISSAFNVQKDAKGKVIRGGVDDELSRVASDIVGNAKIDDKDFREIKQFLFELSQMKNVDLTPENIRSTVAFGALKPNLKKIVDRHFGSASEDEKLRADYKFRRDRELIKATTPDIRNEIDQLVSSGYQDILEEQGIIEIKSDGSYNIKPDAYKKLLAENAIGEGGRLAVSDEDEKTGKRSVSPRQALSAIKNTKIYDWFYKGKEHVKRRITGGMAQDMRRHMGDEVAPDGTKVDLVNATGVTMAAVQELDKRQQASLKDRTQKSILADIEKNTATIVRLLASGRGGGGGARFLDRAMDHGAKGVSRGADVLSSLFGKGVEGLKKGAGTIGDLAKPARDPASKALQQLLSIATAGASRLIGTVTNLTTNLIPKGLKSAKDFAKDKMKSVMSAVDSLLDGARDIYTSDDFGMPKMRAHLMRIGHYYDDSTKKPITKLSDLKKVKGNIRDKAGNIVISLEELAKGLTDAHGTSLLDKATSLKGFLAQKGMEIAQGAADRLRGVWNIAKDKTKGLREKVGSIFSGRGRFGGANDKIYKVLVEIRDILSGKGIGGGGAPDVEFDSGAESSSDGGGEGGARYGGGGGLSAIAGKAKGLLGKGTKAAGDWLDKRRAGKTAGGAAPKGKGGWIGKLAKFGLGAMKMGTKAAGGALGALVGSPGRDISDTADTPDATNTGPAKRIKKRVRNRLGKGAWNDRDGDGRRDGHYLTRIEEMKAQREAAAEARKAARVKQGPRYTDHSKSLISKIAAGAGDFMSWLKDSVGGIIGGAGQVLAALGIGKFLKGKGGLLGKIGGWIGGGGDGPEIDADIDRNKKGRGKGRGGRGGRGRGGRLGKARMPTPKPGNIGNAAKAGRAVQTATQAARGGQTAMTVARTAAPHAARTAAMAAATAKGAGFLATATTWGATALAAVTSVVTAPAFLIGAAAVGLAFGGYYLTKYLMKEKPTRWDPLRLKMYGFGDTDETKKYMENVLALENYFLDGKTIAVRNPRYSRHKNFDQPEKVGKILPEKTKLEEIADIMKFDIEDEEELAKFRAWFENRFVPAYMRHYGYMMSLGKTVSGKSFADIDKLDKMAQYFYFGYARRDFRSDNHGVDFDQIDSPIPELFAIDSGKDSYEDYLEQLNKEYFNNGDWEGRDPKTKPTVQTSKLINTLDDFTDSKDPKGVVAAAASEAAKNAQKVAEAKTAEKAAEKAKTNREKIEELRKRPRRTTRYVPPPMPDAEMNPANVSLGGGGTAVPAYLASKSQGSQPDSSAGMSGRPLNVAPGPLASGDSGSNFVTLKSGASINGIHPKFMKYFYAMAQEYGEMTGKKITVNQGFRSYEQQAEMKRRYPHKAAKPGFSMHEFGLAMDIPTVVAQDLERLGLLRKYGFTRPIGGETWHIEPAGLQIDPNKAKTDKEFAAQAIDASPGRGGGGYGSTKGTPLGRRNPKLALSLLEAADREIAAGRAEKPPEIPDPKPMEPSTSPQMGGAAASGGAASFGGMSGPPDVTGGMSTEWGKRNPPTDLRVKGNVHGISAGYGGGGSSGGAVASGSWSAGSIRESEIKPEGDSAHDSTTQNINPNDKKAILGAISKFSRAAGVDPSVLQAFAIVESGLRPNIKAPTSSALGLFQFINSTWNAMVSKYGRKHNIAPGTSPTDIRASTLLAAEYVKENNRVLKSVREKPNAVDSYMAHFLGAGGARTFFNAGPNAIGAQILPAAARANQGIFYDKGRPRTTTEIYNLLSNRLKSRANDFGVSITTSALADTQAASTEEIDPTTGMPITTAPSVPGSQGAEGANLSSTPSPSTDSYGGSDVGPGPAQGTQLFSPPVDQFTPNAPTERADSATGGLDGLGTRIQESVVIQTQMLTVLTEIRDAIRTNNGIDASGQPNHPASGKRSTTNLESVIDLNRRST